jgi:1-deoxy-D-xylulose-5-phosphate reductoisomerase
MKRIAVLGSTGSIGTQTLDVVARHPDLFRVVAIAAGTRIAELAQQSQRFSPALVSCAESAGERELRAALDPAIRVASGAAGLVAAATECGADLIVAATDGMIALDAVLAAVERGTTVAVANKELIVAAGDLLLPAARRAGAVVLPVDSEHSALFQCLLGEPTERVRTLVLTASGGPFWEWSAAQMQTVTVADALRHPTWQMGTKNTVDSATMMNKGLEAIEAARLFGLSAERIAILVHRSSIAHGFAIFSDGSVKAQLAPPDMRIPIGYALAFPDRLECEVPGDPLTALGAAPGSAALSLTFERPDPARFPCLELAFVALRAGGTAPAALSAANELAVAAFVAGALGFAEIAPVVAAVLEANPQEALTLQSLRAADARAREAARREVARRTLTGQANRAAVRAV